MTETTWCSSRGRAASCMLALALLAGAAPAAAQSTGQTSAQPAVAQPAAPGRLVVERIESGFVFAPEVRVSEIDDRTATLVGGYGGWLTDRTVLIGAGGYWLANGDGREFAYGGAVVEWALRGRERIGFAVRGLVGAGRAELDTTFPAWPVDFDLDVPQIVGQFGRRGGPGRGQMLPQPRVGGSGFTVRIEDTFLVVEPQVSVHWNATPWMRVNVGAGYRLVGASEWFDDRLRGASGSFSLQFGGDGF